MTRSPRLSLSLYHHHVIQRVNHCRSSRSSVDKEKCGGLRNGLIASLKLHSDPDSTMLGGACRSG